MGLRVKIQILNDADEVVVEHINDAAYPTQFKRQLEDPIVDAKYDIFGFTYQPHVRPRVQQG